MRRYWIFILLLQIMGGRAEAATQNDLVVAARALSFMEHPLKGDVIVGIVYVPESDESVRDAQDLQKKIGDGLRVGSLTLKPRLVKLDDLPMADVRLIFLASGIGATGSKLAEITTAKHLPCITFDISQVQNGSCAMGVRAAPKVEVLVNRAAAANSGIVFATVFRMMITEF